jgi:hypothetical protein
MRVRATGGPWISVHRLDAAPVRARLQHGVVRYDGVLPQLDAQVFATEHGVEDLWTVHRQAPNLGYRLDLPDGWTLRRSDALRLVEVLDDASSSRLRVWAHEAWDREGSPLFPELIVQGNQILVHLPNHAKWPVVVDPEWTGADTLVLPRLAPTLTQLPSGRVLVAGGDAPGTGTCEWFDPEKGTFSVGPKLLFPREGHSAHLLPSGRVLLIGGQRNETPEPTAELYDPSEEAFSPVTPALPVHGTTNVSLADGRVMVAGGRDQSTVKLLQLYDPTTNTFHRIGDLLTPRADATGTLIASGEVLIVGGRDSQGAPLNTTEVCHPSGSCIAGPPLQTPRVGHSATLLPSGRVMIAGGSGSVDIEVIDVKNATVQTFASELPHDQHQAVLLPDGNVLVIGGREGDGDVPKLTRAVDPLTGASAVDSELAQGRHRGAASLLYDGRVLVLGGDPSPQTAELRPVPVYTKTFESNVTVRPGHTATLLPNGDVLLAGGDEAVPSVDRWSRKESRTSPVSSMVTPRVHHAAVQLRTGRVLITGGRSLGSTSRKAEVYEWRQQRFDPVEDMLLPRARHALTLLPTGAVLVTGGSDEETVESYDPATGKFEEAGNLIRARRAHAAVLLPSGRVLIAGGVDGSGKLVDVAELWNVDEGRSEALSNTVPRGGVAAGAMSAFGVAVVTTDRGTFAFSPWGAEVEYQPAVVGQPFAAIPSLFEGVLFCGRNGQDATTCVMANPNTREAAEVVSFDTVSTGATATHLIDGDLLVRGAFEDGSVSVKVHRVPPKAVRPSIDKAPLEVRIGEEVTIEGRRFTSPSAVGSEELGPMPWLVPGVFFVPAEQGPAIPIPVDAWTDGELGFTVPSTMYRGRGWLHVMVAGVPSLGWYLDIQPRSQGAGCSVNEECGSGHCVEGVCCDSPCQQGCMSCLGRATGAGDGNCQPVREGLDSKDACEERLCGMTGTCDGQGECAWYGERQPCEEGRLCLDRECVATLGQPCQSKHDCAGGQVCSAGLSCVELEPRAAAKDPGACSLGGSSQSGRGVGWALLLWGIVLGLRRRAGVRVLRPCRQTPGPD